MCAAAAVVVLLAGCTNHPADTAAPSSTVTPAAPVLDVTIADGTVTPTNAELSARVGEPITIDVTSDTADELHVHAVPEHEFEVKPAAGQHFRFTVDVPGRVEVELHHLNRTVAVIQVRP